jgi:hypothetical protein
MFAMASLALTMLLGFARAVLAQNYVSQMTPRIRYCGGSNAHRSSAAGLFKGQNADRTSRFEHVWRTRANVIARVRFWKMSRAPRARQTT